MQTTTTTLRLPASRFSLVLITACMLILSTSHVRAQVRLVKDINTNPTDSFYGARVITAHGSIGHRSFFIIDGNEIWTTDGTAAGTVYLQSVFSIREWKVSGNLFFFSAFDHDHGFELWKSDGTIAGTKLLKDIYPGRGDGAPTNLVDVNGILYFSANNSVNGRELWKTDGSLSGTVMVKDIFPGSASSNVREIAALNNSVLFVANDGVSGYELWLSNGTSAGTAMVMDIFPGTMSSAPKTITVANGVAYFSASAPLVDRQLWKSDGTLAGTMMVKVVRPGMRSAKIEKITAVNSLVFFQADDGVHGAELWRSDGTASGTYLLLDISPGPGSTSTDNTAHIDHLTAVNGKLFFTGLPEFDIYTYISDGSPGGTMVLPNAPMPVNKPGFWEYNDNALFLGYSGSTFSYDLYFSDGSTSAVLKQGVGASSGGGPQFQLVNGNILFFAAGSLWKSDFTSSGTSLVKNLHRKGSGNPNHLTDAAGTLFFVQDKDLPFALYKTDGTDAGTTVARFTNPMGELGAAGHQVFFTATAPNGGGIRPWVSDGTMDGTFPLSAEAGFAQGFQSSAGMMYFNARGPLGEELWKSDGTASGTVLVKDIRPGSVGSFPGNLTDVNGTLFFTASTDAEGEELWKSDGTTSGTTLVKDINVGPSSSGINEVISHKNRTYFLASDNTSGQELWVSNGTPTGTYRVTDQNESFITSGLYEDDIAGAGDFVYYFTLTTSVTPNIASLWRTAGVAGDAMKLREFNLPAGSMIRIIGKRDKGIFIGYRSGPDFELWRSWGTQSSTVKVRTFRNHTYDHEMRAAVLNNVLYFGTSGTVWRSDGNGPGTYQLPFFGDAFEFTASGPYVYFRGESVEYGYELFLIDESTSSIASASRTNDKVVVSENTVEIARYPNPFVRAFTIHTKSSSSETFRLAVTDMKGHAVLEDVALATNVNHVLGASWIPGLYILHIEHDGKKLTSMIVKSTQ